MLKITDTQSGRHTVVDQVSKSKTTYATPNIVNQYRITPSTTCLGTPSEPILGYATTKGERRVTYPDNKTFRIVSWRSADLNCLPLREEQWITGSNGRERLSMVLSATTIVVGKPEGWLFEIPADYVERSPAEAMGEKARIRGNAPTEPNEGLEQIYNSLNAKT